MLQPKRTKFRKQFKGRNDGLSWSANAVSFGEYGLKATDHGRLTARQIEAARRTISRYVKRGGKMWIRVFPDKPITKKPIEVRMGSGKGGVEYWVAQIQPGRMIYEIEGVPEETAREAFRLAAAKLSVTTTFVTRTVRSWRRSTNFAKSRPTSSRPICWTCARSSSPCACRVRPVSCPRPTKPAGCAARSRA